VAQMRATGQTGSVVSLICDGGERYAHTYYNDEWLAARGLDVSGYEEQLTSFAPSV
jgi:cysteine synthase A